MAMGSSAEDSLTIEIPHPQVSGNYSNSWVFSGNSGSIHSMGQMIKATNPDYLNLSSFSFKVANFLPFGSNPTNHFKAYIYKWDSNTNRIVGNALYASNLLELTTQPNNGINNINYTNVTVNTDIKLSLNQEYALFFAALDGGSGSYRIAVDRNNPYLDGGYIYSTSTDFNNLFVDAWTASSVVDVAFSLLFTNPTPSAEDTFASMQNNASSLRQIFALQSDALYDGLNYSCDYFNQDNSCISFVGKYSKTNESDNVDATSGIIKVAHKLSPNFYVGGFLEQIISDVDTQGVTYRQKAPDVGIYTGWTQKENGDGWQARLAYRHSNGQVSIQREAIGTAEAGFGKTELNSDGYQLSIGNAIRVNNSAMVTPYIGIRYSEITRQSYSEHLTNDVTRPLHYDDLTQKTTTAFAGAKFDTPIFSKIALTGSFGVEKDLNKTVNDYSATGVYGLDSIVFNDHADDVRAVATLGANYNFSQNQQLGIQAAYREQSYDPSSTTSAYISYTTSF